jgi:hypothetical protein
VPETVCGDLMTLGGERAHQIAMDMRDDRRDREGRRIPRWRSISRNAESPWLAPNNASGVARSAAVTPSAPEATLRSTVTATQQRAPSGQRISESARLPLVGEDLSLPPLAPECSALSYGGGNQGNHA